MLQVGAQNQNTVGLPAAAAPSKVPPPTSGAVNWSASGTTTGASVGVGASLGAGADVASVAVFDGAVAPVVGVGASVVSAAAAGGEESAESSDSEAQAVAANSSTVAPMAPSAARRRVDVTR
jgi:hypothetical protein